MVKKFGLGTAQLGSNYGIANCSGMPDYEESFQILDTALENDFFLLDTAPAYGKSEKIIGKWGRNKNRVQYDNILLLSKLPVLDDYSCNRIIEEVLNKSLNLLNKNRIDYYLIHDYKQIFVPGFPALNQLIPLRHRGLIGKIGISVYHPEEAFETLKYPDLEIIEIPLNLFDQRFLEGNLLEKLKEEKKTVICRSIFLQGLFFISKEKLPPAMQEYDEIITNLYQAAEKAGNTVYELACRFPLGIEGIDIILTGTETKKQLAEFTEVIKRGSLDKKTMDICYQLKQNDKERLINPSLWRLK